MSEFEKTKEQLAVEATIEASAKKEREKSDSSYAIKLVEKIVFYAVGAIAIAFLMGLIGVVWKWTR